MKVISFWQHTEWFHLRWPSIDPIVLCICGGDRDGNPRVTPEVTRDVCLLARMMVANLYYSQIEDLMFELSMWHCSDELRE